MDQEKTGFVLGKKNAIYIALGFLISVLGFILMSGGAGTSPDEFNESEIFSFRRITLAPIVVLLGFLIVGIGIMVKPEKTFAEENK